MNWICHVLAILATAVTMTGCASTRAYMVDRGRDAADIVTVTAGTGLGVKVKAGPLATGLILNGDIVGLRGGETFANLDYENLDIWLPVPVSGELDWLCGLEEWDARDPNARHKSYGHSSCFPLVISDLFGDKKDGWSTPYPYQVEVGAGLGLSLHVGLNPAEALDFLLGWVGIDIFKDDVESMKRKSNNPEHAAGKPAPNR